MEKVRTEKIVLTRNISLENGMCPHFKKSYLLFMSILFVMIGLLISSANAEENKVKWGVSVLGGIGDAFYRKADMKEYGFLPRISLPLYKKSWDLEFEGDFFYYDIHKMHNLYFLELSNNIVFKPVQEK